jgi:hypothetical protein
MVGLLFVEEALQPACRDRAREKPLNCGEMSGDRAIAIGAHGGDHDRDLHGDRHREISGAGLHRLGLW